MDGSGEVVDYLKLNHLLKRRQSPIEREREEKVGVRGKRGGECAVGMVRRNCLCLCYDYRRQT